MTAKLFKTMLATMMTTGVIGVTTLQAANADDLPYLHEGQTCLSIGNIKGEGPVTCKGPGGHNYGKAGTRFETGDKIYILLRLRNLTPGEHSFRARFRRGQKVAVKLHRMFKSDDSDSSWAYWLAVPAKAKESGSWTVDIMLDGIEMGPIRYGVDTILE